MPTVLTIILIKQISHKEQIQLLIGATSAITIGRGQQCIVRATNSNLNVAQLGLQNLLDLLLRF